MHATGLLKEDRFQEIFTNYIDVLERHFDELKGTLFAARAGRRAAPVTWANWERLRVLKENLSSDAAAIESRFVTRDQQTRQLGQPRVGGGKGGGT